MNNDTSSGKVLPWRELMTGFVSAYVFSEFLHVEEVLERFTISAGMCLGSIFLGFIPVGMLAVDRNKISIDYNGMLAATALGSGMIFFAPVSCGVVAIVGYFLGVVLGNFFAEN